MLKKLFTPQTRLSAEDAKALAQTAQSLADCTAQSALLARDNAELTSVFGAMREGVVALSEGGHVTRINAAAADLLGIPAEKARGRLLAEVVRHSEVARVARAALAGKAEEGEADLFTPGSDNTLTRRVFQVLGAPLPGRDGAVVVLHDVTELRRLEVVRQDFIANASHEIRTPVAAIQAAVETLTDAPEEIPPADRDRFMGILVRQSLRLSAIVEDLLAISSLERGHGLDAGQLRPEVLSGILATSVEACTPRAIASKAQITVTCDEGLSVPCEANMLERAVINLLENAIKYGPVEGHVSLCAKTSEGSAVIEVSDHGPGIPAEHLPRIFERFYRTDKARSREMGGTGLGLAIVKHIAEAHGGKATVESKVGVGSVFRIHLPLAPGNAGHPSR